MGDTEDPYETRVVMVATPGGGVSGIGDFAEDLVAHMTDVRVRMVTLPPDSNNPLSYVRRAVRVGTADPDVVHVQHEYGEFGSFALMSWVFFPGLYLLSALLGFQVVLTIHEGLNRHLIAPPAKPLKQLYIALLNRYLVLGADHVVFLSERTKREFTKSVGPGPHSVLPHGVNTDRRINLPRDEAKRRFGYEPTDVVISEPGYVEPRKGCEAQIELAERLPEYEFLIAGGPPSETYEDELNSIRRRAPENLHVTGRLSEERFHAAFVASDIVVLPYREIEQRGVLNMVNQSGIFNRCATYEKPVIAADLEYFRTLKEECNCLWVQDFEDCDAAAGAVERLIGDEAERKRLAESIGAYAETNSFASVADRHETLYNRIIGRSRDKVA